MVGLHQGEDDDMDDSEFEDSDYDGSSGQYSKPVPEKQTREGKAPERDPLPVITTGSFSRYVRPPVAVGRVPLTLAVAGDHLSSTCTQTS